MSVEFRLPTDLDWSNGTLNGSISNPLKVAQNDPLFVGYPMHKFLLLCANY